LAISSTASSTIVIKGTDYKFDLIDVMKKPSVYTDGCHVNYGEPESGECTYGDINAKRTIVLYGDSHAAHWFPTLETLANERRFKLVSLTKSACPSVDVPRDDRGAFKQADCDQWRFNSIARIKEIAPTAVILSNFQYFTPPSQYPDRNTWWNDGQRRLLTSLRGASDHLVYINDTPHPSRDIPNCLAAGNSKACDTTEKTPVQIISGFEKIDPTPWLCTDLCPAFKDGYVVYRDASHLTVDAALALTAQLEAALVSLRIFS
jgi:hypothetical protein